MTKVKAKPIVHRVTDSGASAKQTTRKDGQEVVNLKNIKVAVYPKGRFWIAQALEIDYISQGKDAADAKRTFENGLAATIHQHLTVYGHINNILQFAPADVRLHVLDQLLENPDSIHATFSQITVHNAPNIAIEYVSVAA